VKNTAAFATGCAQGVLVHVDVGTANTTTAMHNIFISPFVLTARASLRLSDRNYFAKKQASRARLGQRRTSAIVR
jgi:hypothetical protein